VGVCESARLLAARHPTTGVAKRAGTAGTATAAAAAAASTPSG